MFLIQKYTQYKAAQAEQQKKKVTEKELAQLNHKIDKLLTKLDEHEPETADNEDEECVVCVNAKATMTTYPCAHRVICRKCFVKTIQVAVASRLLPLRCVICRAKVLRLKHCAGPALAGGPSSDGNWYHVPQSASLYSVTSNTSALSGVSSSSSCSSTSSYKTAASTVYSRKSYYSVRARKQGYEPLVTSSSSAIPRSSSATGSLGSGSSSRKVKGSIGPLPAIVSKAATLTPTPPPAKGKLKLVQDFQREFRIGVEKIQSQNQRTASAGSSTRIKCAKGLICQAQSSCRPGPGAPLAITATTLPMSSSLRKKSAKSSESSGSSDANTPRGRPSVPPPSSSSCPSFKQQLEGKHLEKSISRTSIAHKHTTLPAVVAVTVKPLSSVKDKEKKSSTIPSCLKKRLGQPVQVHP